MNDDLDGVSTSDSNKREAEDSDKQKGSRTARYQFDVSTDAKENRTRASSKPNEPPVASDAQSESDQRQRHSPAASADSLNPVRTDNEISVERISTAEAIQNETVLTSGSSDRSMVEACESTLASLPALPADPGLDRTPPGRSQPPSYTSVELRRQSMPFVPPVPPPSYGEVMGIDHLRSPRPSPVVVNVGPSVWTHRPQQVYCRNCHAFVVSKIKHSPCLYTHLAAALLFLFLCWPFCLVPYCSSYCQQTRHHCPSCDQLLGVYNPTV